MPAVDPLSRSAGDPAALPDRPWLSVVIPTYHDSHCLALTLESLSRQTLPAHQFEVIVVGDGGSVDDDVVKRIAAMGYRYLELAEHVGRGSARNRGIEVSRGEVILFLDSDSYTAPDLLARHAEFHRAGGCRVMLGKRWEIGWSELDDILSGATVDPGTFPPTVTDLRFPAWLGADELAEMMTTPWLFTYTNNVSVPRQLVESVGGFDEEYGTRWGFEDLELFYRVYLALDRDTDAFVYDPAACCHHLPHHRSGAGTRDDYWVNMRRTKDMYPTYEWEFTGLIEPIHAAARIRRYRGALAASVDTPGCQAGPVWRRAADLLGIAPGARLLVVGLGSAELGLPDGTATLDPGRAIEGDNRQLLGYATGYDHQDFDVAVNLNLWRWFGVHDLSRYVEESLRIARTSVLVYSTDFALPEHLDGVRDLDYIVDLFTPHLTTSLRWAGPDAVLTLSRDAVKR